MHSDRTVTRQERRLLKRKYGCLFNEISAILFALDPMGLNCGSNRDEYDLEAGFLLPRLSGARSVQDVEVIVAQMLDHWFGPEAGRCKPMLGDLAARIWACWQQAFPSADRTSPSEPA